MSGRFSQYAHLITTKKIHYVPTCLFIEILASVYGYVIRVPICRETLGEERARIMKILEIFQNDLAATLDAYNNGDMQFFSGDWKTIRPKARQIFTLFMKRLDKLHYFFWGPYQVRLREYMDRFEKNWAALCELLDGKCCSQCRDRNTTRYFNSGDQESWQRTMANIIADLHEKTESEEGKYLLLICSERIKTRLLKQIEQLQVKRGDLAGFNADCILCISRQDADVTCPRCMRFSDGLLHSPKAPPADFATPYSFHPAYQAVADREQCGGKQAYRFS